VRGQAAIAAITGDAHGRRQRVNDTRYADLLDSATGDAGKAKIRPGDDEDDRDEER
jgi:hypothetical protein